MLNDGTLRFNRAIRTAIRTPEKSMGRHFNESSTFVEEYEASMLGYEKPERIACCKHCRHSFKKGKNAARVIKDQIPWKILGDFGPVVLNVAIFGPIGVVFSSPDWQAVMDVPHAWKAYNADKDCDVLEAARFPCPICGRDKWKEGGVGHKTRYIYEGNPKHKKWWGDEDWFR
jgi:hypothetical protein